MEYARRRRHPRFDVDDVHGSFQFSEAITVRNLGLGGMALESPRALNVGRTFTFDLEAGPSRLRIPGRVKWCSLSPGHHRRGDAATGPVYDVGVAFEGVLTDLAGQVLELIESKAAFEMQTRVFGRFRVEEAAATMVSGLEFEVRRISLSGMLAEVNGLEHGFAHTNAVIPFELDLDGAPIRGRARIAWINRESSSGQPTSSTELGLEFIELEPEHRSRLEAYVSSLVAAKSGDL